MFCVDGIYCVKDGSGYPAAKRGVIADSLTRSEAEGHAQIVLSLTRPFGHAHPFLSLTRPFGHAHPSISLTRFSGHAHPSISLTRPFGHAHPFLSLTRPFGYAHPILLFVFLLIFLAFGSVAAQDLTPGAGTSADSIPARSVVAGGDTIPNFLLGPVFVTGKLIFKNRRERIRYTKLRRDVLKVLPYAKFAGAKYREMEDELLNAKTVKEQKEIIDVIEKDIKENFEKDLRKLTITQGKILIKLIDRETGRTGYVLLQELKSRFTAFFWQSVARVFGHNLKDRYDPEEEKEIEKVIRSVEMDRYYQLYNGEYYLQVQHRKDQRAKD